MQLFTIFILTIQNVMCEYDMRVITTQRYSRFNITPTVVNGKPANTGDIPYLVSLKEPFKKLETGYFLWENLCGGTIIDTKRILTAAHCFEGNKFYYAKNPERLRVVAGDIRNDIIHSGETETTMLSQWRQIQRVTIHSRFHFPNNDIALAYMNVPWEFDHRVNSIDVATVDEDYRSECFTAGYGRVGHQLRDRVSPVLLTADISVMPRWKCTMLWEMNMNSFVCTDSAITDVAMGDSGGPLICKVKNGTQGEKKVLVGVVSGKNYDKTTLYTRLSAYHDWIEHGGGANNLRVNLVCFVITVFLLIYLLF